MNHSYRTKKLLPNRSLRRFGPLKYNPIDLNNEQVYYNLEPPYQAKARCKRSPRTSRQVRTSAKKNQPIEIGKSFNLSLTARVGLRLLQTLDDEAHIHMRKTQVFPVSYAAIDKEGRAAITMAGPKGFLSNARVGNG